MTDFDIVRDHKSLFLLRREVLTGNIAGFETGVDVLKARNFLNDSQLEKVKEIRARKLAGTQLTSYSPL